MITERILLHYKIRSTEIRKAILAIFLKQDFALSHADLEKALNNQCDRVTIYRTLKTFQDKGIIHRVRDEYGVAQYALSNTETFSSLTREEEHLHFQCQKCRRTYCLNHISLPLPNLPQGFQLNSLVMLAEGVCKKCLSPA